MIKFEKLTPGMRLADIHRYRTNAGSRLGLWWVEIVSVDTAKRTAQVRWNGNSPRSWPERDLKKLYAEDSPAVKRYLESCRMRTLLRTQIREAIDTRREHAEAILREVN